MQNFPKIIYLNPIVLSILFLLSNAYFAGDFFLNSIGAICIIIIILFSFYNLLNRSLTQGNNTYGDLVLIASLYILIMLVNVNTYSVTSIYKILMQFSMLMVISSFSKYDLHPNSQRIVVSFFAIAFFIICIVVFFMKKMELLTTVEKDNYSLVALKSLFACSFFFLFKMKKLWIGILGAVFLNLLIGERTAVLVTLLIFFIYHILNFIKSRNLYKVFFFFFISICLFFPFFYINLKYSKLAPLLQELSRKYTDGNFFSGRERLWEEIISANHNTIWYGLGIDTSFKSLTESDLSTHNLYVYLYATGGIVAILLFVFFTYLLWLRFIDCMHDKFVRLSASFFLGILFFCDFELLLLTNNAAVSLLFWFIIGLGIMRRNYIMNNEI